MDPVTLLVLAAAAAGAYYYYSKKAHPSGAGPKCPTDDALKKMLADVVSGTIDAPHAAALAKNFDASGCSSAANAIRVASAAASPPGGLTRTPLVPSGLKPYTPPTPTAPAAPPAAPSSSPYDIAHTEIVNFASIPADWAAKNIPIDTLLNVQRFQKYMYNSGYMFDQLTLQSALDAIFKQMYLTSGTTDPRLPWDSVVPLDKMPPFPVP
jgi:hypothetical protein